MTPTTTPGASATKRKVYVVAGSHPDYCQYLREQHLTPKDAIFVRTANQMRGIENPDVRYVGNYEDVRELEEIRQVVRVMTRPT